MRLHCRTRSKRRGAAAVETALVMMLFTSLVFGLFEYCRMYMEWNLMNNAAREGCRYALANNTSSTLSTDVTTLVTGYMAGQTSCFTGFSVTVAGTSNGVSTSVGSLMPGDMISVTVSGPYKFMNIVPLIKLPTTFTMSSTVSMVCEGGM